MKKIVLTTAILAIGAVAAQAGMFTNDIAGVANNVNGADATVGTALTTTLITDNTAPPQTLVVTLSDLNLDDTGGLANDSIALTFTATGDGQNLQTSGTGAAGWLSSGGTTLNADGEFVAFTYTSMTITADDMTGVSASFLGFTEVTMGSWAGGHISDVNGTAYPYIDGVQNKFIELANVASVTTGYFTTSGSAGSFRPENYNFQIEIDAPVDNIPEPATLGMVAAFGGAILFIRRRVRFF